ncbi:hypothetical protein [Modestobacter sp. NPDC049651]|uniref:hypothetical protein n=1 Tax=unclassified Modestobacter TaxID=2643866 RepID=UPI0033E2DE73
MDTGDVTSIVLAALTAVYVVYTGRLNHHTRDSAVAAKASAAASEAATTAALETAQASRRAAEAAERSAALSEAVTPVNFTARVVATGSRGVAWIRSESASVYVFSANIKLLVVPATTGTVREVQATVRIADDDGTSGAFVHQGDELLAPLPEILEPGDTVFGHATVTYSFGTEPPGRERFIEVGRQQVTAEP